MNRKQILLLVWMLVAVVCIGGAVYIGGRALLLRRALELRSEGLAAARAGDDARAADLLLQYIHRRPRDTDAIKSYLQSRQRVPMTSGQQYADTIGALKLLLQQEPARIEDLRYLLELYARLERGPDAIGVADTILKSLPKDARTLELKTQALTQQHQYEDALQCAERWAATSPEDLDAQMTRLTLYFQVGRSPESIIADAQSLGQSHPGDARFEVLQGFALARAGESAKAIQLLQTAAKHPDLSDAIAHTIVDQFDSLGSSTDALALLQDRVNHGASAELRHMLGERLWELRRWKEAAEALSDVNPSDLTADPTLIALKAIALANLGRGADAGLCRKALDANVRPDAHAWTELLGGLLGKSSVNDKQLTEDCRAAIAFDPRNPYLEYFLGDCERRLGEIDLAISAFVHSANLDVHWNLPAIRLVECLLDTQQPEQALNVARVIAARKPMDASTAIILAQAAAAGIENGEGRQADSLLSFITDIQKQLPGEDETLPIIKVQLLAQQGKRVQAIQAAREAITHVPPPPEQVFKAIATVSRRYAFGLEAECFRAWERATGITSALAYAEALDEVASGRPAEGLRVFDRLANQSGKGGEVDWRLDRTQYLDAIGDPGAKAAWIALRDAFPDDLTVQRAALYGRAVQGDWQFMQPVIQRLRALTGDDGLAWRLAEASLMINAPRGEEDYEKGSVELNALIEMYPQLDQPHVLLAKALVHMKRLDGAISQLTTATKLNPDSVPIALQLVALLQSHGDTDKAAAELDRISRQPLSDQQREWAASLLAKGGNAGRAIELLKQPRNFQSAATQPAQDDTEDLLLASLYRQQRQPDKAEAIAHELLHRPNLAVIQFAASLFFADGHPADAAKALSLLDGLTLQPGIKDGVLGSFYYTVVRDLPQAARYFAAATMEAPGIVKAWRSLAICQMAQGHAADALATIDAGLGANPKDAELAALRKLSPLLIEAGKDEELRSLAIAVLENPSDGNALDLIGTVLEGHRTNDLARLAPRLKQFSEQHPDYAPAQLQLIQCYVDMGEPSDAIATAQHAMAVFPDDPDLARAAVDTCLAASRWQEMESAAENWKAHSPDSAEAADTAAATAENHLQHFQEALSRLQPYLDAAKQDQTRHGDVLVECAVAYAGTGDSAAARDLLWPLATKSAVWRQRWIQLAIETPDAAQATAMLDRLGGTIRTDALAEQAALAQAYDYLGGEYNNPTLINRATEMFDTLAKNDHADVVVLLSAAAQAERCKQFVAAEALYRRVLVLNPNVWIAQNNLANLMADRGGDLKEAEQLAHNAVRLQPREPNVYDTLGQIQAKEGNPRAAADTERLAVQLNPSNASWRISLARYLLDAGELSEASKALTAIDTEVPDLRSQPADVLKQLSDLRSRIHGKGT